MDGTKVAPSDRLKFTVGDKMLHKKLPVHVNTKDFTRRTPALDGSTAGFTSGYNSGIAFDRMHFD